MPNSTLKFAHCSHWDARPLYGKKLLNTWRVEKLSPMLASRAEMLLDWSSDLEMREENEL